MRGVLLGLAFLCAGCPGVDDERVCDGKDEACSCQALEAGWCIEYQYEHEDAPGNLPEGECESRGGEEVAEGCPSANRLGVCVNIEDCYQPAYHFYDGYAGGIFDLDDVDEAQARCEASDITGCSAWEWTD
jgi:hypothetical protein